MRCIYYLLLLIIFFCIAIVSALLFTRLIGLAPAISFGIAGVCCIFIYYQKDGLFHFFEKFL